MTVTIKTDQEIEKMRIAGKLASEVLDMIEEHVKVGVTTDELDRICHDYIVNEQKAIPAPLNYRGFPKSICTSVNHVICHGIPGEKKLKKGDIINIDVTVIKDEYHGDNSRMYYVGKPSILAKRLCEVTLESMMTGIRMVKPGVQLGDIGHEIQKHAESHNFSVVREYCGLTIEPMINAGKRETRLLADDWTVVTRDHSLSAQWEHTILVTKDGYEILTNSTNAVLP